MKPRISIFALLLVASWVIMTLTHEFGHIAGGWIGGATLTDYDAVPWRLPYSLHSPDPNPLLTLWAGPILGILVPVLLALLLRHPWIWLIADFCLIANGVYLALAWISGDRYLDTARLLNAGARPATIAMFCIVTIAVGYVRFRSDCVRFFRPSPQTNDATSSTIQSDAAPNPYEAPSHAGVDVARRDLSLLPKSLAHDTRVVVNRFGLFQFIWPMLVAYWTDAFVFDFFALFIATNGRRVTRVSFRRFPWTAVMCGVYPIAFVTSALRSDLSDVWNWLPARFSPVLGLQLASSAWALYASWMILRCYFAHQAISRAR